MSDLISRKDLIDWLTSRIVMLKGIYGDLGGAVSGVRKMVRVMPSAEPERKKGEWVDYDAEDINDYPIEAWQTCRCTSCGKWHTTPYKYNFDQYPFCPNCGARMTRGE